MNHHIFFGPWQRIALCLCLAGLWPIPGMYELHGQGRGTQMDFGKNRVQYKDFDWFYYRSPHFDVYFYREGQEMAGNIGRLAEQVLKDLERELDYSLNERIQILSYNKLSDLHQSNLGLEEEFYNTGGRTTLVAGKLFIPFSGSMIELHAQLRSSLGRVMINEMLYGGNLRELIQTAALLHLPDWYINGLESWLGQDWSIEQDEALSRLIKSGKITSFNKVYGPENTTLVGHSVWKYIADEYGAGAVSSILYMTRINRSSEAGFQYILGKNYAQIFKEWHTHMETVYGEPMPRKGRNKKLKQERRAMPEFVDGQLIPLKKQFKQDLRFYGFTLSPDGSRMAFIRNHRGRIQIRVYNFNDNKEKVLYRMGRRTWQRLDKNSPVLAWHPSGMLLALAYDRKSIATITTLRVEERQVEHISLERFEKVLDLDYSPDGRKLALSVMEKGQSDIFLFDMISRREEQITNDWHDDLYPRWSKDGRYIYFSSSRDSALFLGAESFQQMPAWPQLDLYAYYYLIRDPELIRLTHSTPANEKYVWEPDSGKLAWLSDASGHWNRETGQWGITADRTVDTVIYGFDTTWTYFKDTLITQQVTSFPISLSKESPALKSKSIVQVVGTGPSPKVVRGITTGTNKARADQSTSESVWAAQKKGRYELYLNRQEELRLAREMAAAEKALKDSVRRQDSLELAQSKARDTLVSDSLQDVPPLGFHYFPQTARNPKAKEERAAPAKLPELNARSQEAQDLSAYFKPSSARPYTPLFAADYVVSQFANSLLVNTYEPFTGTGPIYHNTGVNGLFKLGSSDLMEDYRVTGGFRLAGNFTIPEYFLRYQNLKKRLDKELMFYRQGSTGFALLVPDPSIPNLSPIPVRIKDALYEVQGGVTWPFDESKSVGLKGFYRKEDLTILSTDPFSLSFPNRARNWAGLRSEFTVDNTLRLDENLFRGFRGKVYLEHYRHINTENTDLFFPQNAKPIQISNLGLDMRYYLPIHRQFIYAFRMAGAASFDHWKTAYYLGGLDGWLAPRWDQSTQIDFGRNYLYQALATNMRGFDQNIRNGNMFLLGNHELRFPVFRYLSKRPIKSDFIRNFQVLGFGDVGSAWVGINPFSDENIYNKTVRRSGPLTITIIEERFPIVGGYGWGLRSKVLGYWIRADWAWGVQNGLIGQRKFYLSLSLDF